ncbi:MAG TPA: hypothetical protein VF592_05720 [Sphingomonas sp.]|uniref:hypothetical protein n=1 Tax=Sphingomonas sp. TaxID=28214 RepID=UPI002ED8815D
MDDQGEWMPLADACAAVWRKGDAAGANNLRLWRMLCDGDVPARADVGVSFEYVTPPPSPKRYGPHPNGIHPIGAPLATWEVELVRTEERDVDIPADIWSRLLGPPDALSEVWSSGTLPIHPHGPHGERGKLCGVRVGRARLELFAGPLRQPSATNQPAQSDVTYEVATDAQQPLTAKPGRPLGTGQYASDAGIVAQVIASCDDGQFTGDARVRRAIKSVLAMIEPPVGGDEGKIKRIRNKVLAVRPDLRN